MAKYIALKDFYKISQDKYYKVGDEIELTEEIAESIVIGGFVELVKVEAKKTKK
jgi:hypothetical protein